MVRAKPTFAAMGVIAAAMLLSLWTAGGCTVSQKTELGMTSHWERQLGWPRGEGATAPDRRVAESGPRCLKDRLTPAFLHQEVARMESAQGAKVLDGKWEDVALSRMSGSQAQYLKKFGNRWIDKDDAEFSTCSDLPCILNRNYGTAPTSEEGWKIYAFYLRMGYGLSTSKWLQDLSIGTQELPVHFDPVPLLSSFLFSDAQLNSFWKLSWLLPESYRNMPTIQTIHRVPENYLPPMFTRETCAISYGSQSSGVIQLRICLDEAFQKFVGEGGTTDNGIHGDFYKTVTHEMTHSWDRMQAKKSVLVDPLSLSDEWRAFSGWNCHPVLTNGKISSTECQSNPTKEGFVRDYAGTNPAEDLAETAAWLRFRPDLVKKRSPAKADFISTKIFGGRTYDSEGLSRYYRDSTVTRIDSKARLDLVNTCMSSTSTAGGSSKNEKGPHLMIEQPLPGPVTACLEREVNQLVDDSFELLRAQEWEACDHLNVNDADLRAQVFANVSAEISSLVANNVERAPLIRATSDLRAALISQVDAREGYIHCIHQPAPELCFQQSLSDAFERVAQPYSSVLGEILSEEKQTFLALHPYVPTAGKVNLFYQQVFAGVEPQLKSSAEARWQSCVPSSNLTAAPGTADVPLVQPFSGGTHFVASSILNCINKSFAEDLKTVRDQFSAHLGLTVTDPDVQILIQDQLLPSYLDALRTKEEVASAAEDASRDQRKAGVLEVLKRELLANLSWLGSAAQYEAAQAQCESAGQNIFDTYFSRVSASEQLPSQFASIADVRGAWSREACKEVVANTKVTQRVSERSNVAWTAAMKSLEQVVLTRARDTATDCIARNPGSSRYTPVKNRRRQCMTAGWTMVEKQAVASWEQTTPEGQTFTARHQDSVNYLSSRRKSMQVDAFTAMDSR